MAVKVLVVTFSATREGEIVPEAMGTIRVPWPDDHTLEDVLAGLTERARQELHAREHVWWVA